VSFGDIKAVLCNLTAYRVVMASFKYDRHKKYMQNVDEKRLNKTSLRRLLISSLDLPALIKRDFKTTATVNCPDFSMCKISPDDSNGRNRLN
jgi:hypothetical protein